MPLRNTEREFGSVAKWLHWLVAAGLFVVLAMGLEQLGMERGPERAELRAVHGSIALVVFMLMTVRIVWRWINGVPGHPEGTPAWQQVSATVAHWALYAGVFTQLISGSMTVATNGNGIPFFGTSIPVPVAENHDAHEFWEGVHALTWKVIAGLLVLHVFAALYNHFIAHNDVLRRMTVGLKSRE